MGELTVVLAPDLPTQIITGLRMCEKKPPETWVLLSVDQIDQAILALGSDADVSNQDHAAKLAEVLLGSYPRHNVDDPKIYSRGVVSVFMKFPTSVGAKAVDDLTLTKKFIPARAEIFEACQKIQNETDRLMRIAKRMKQEVQFRIDEKNRLAEIEADRMKFRKKHGDKSPLDVLKEQGKWGDTANSKDKQNG